MSELSSTTGIASARFWLPSDAPPRLATDRVVALAGIKLLLHLALSWRYGYFRDELYYLACGRHLAWGYVDHAPLIAFVARLALQMGGSLPVLRAFPAVAGSLLVALTMLIAWRLGANRFGQTLAGLCVLAVPIYLAIDSLLTMNAFEPLFWMGGVYVLIRFIQTGNSKLWIGFGVLAGLGLMNKHSTVFFGLAVIAGLLATEYRTEFKKPWIWIGAGIAVLIFLPNLIWQMQHHFPTLEDLRNVRATGKNVVLPPLQFISQQVMVMNPTLLLVWLAGLWSFLIGEKRRYRLLGWVFLVFFAEMMLLHGKDYYVVPIYPMLLASGAVSWERVLEAWRFTQGQRWPKTATLAVVAAAGAILAPLMLPLLSPPKYLSYLKLLGFPVGKREVSETSPFPQFLSDQFGWPDLVFQVAQIYNSLPPTEREQTGILTGNYGGASAIDEFGPKYGLPPAMSGHQTYFYWGTRGFTGHDLIVLEEDPEDIQAMCNSVQAVATHSHPWGMPYENRSIYFCRGLKRPLAQIWPSLKHWD